MRDTWWLWLVGVAVAAAIVVGLLRSRRAAPRRGPADSRPGTRPGTGTRGGAVTRPVPGEIWWAEVPFEDGSGEKVRPCLVLRTHRRRVDVLKITSQDQRDRRDHVEIPTRHWDRRATHNSFLDLSDPLRITERAFERKAGVIDSKTWTLVRQMHRVSG